jgi:putative two-component system response regulator
MAIIMWEATTRRGWECRNLYMSISDGAFRVLVIDDEPAVSRMLQRLLSNEGYAVQVATDFASARKAIDRENPDVILLDVVLPDLDGFTICRRLKDDAATRLTPVILVTGRTDRQSRIEGRLAGADDFLTKPVDPQELVARVSSLARLKRYTDDLDSAASIVTTLAVMIEARDGFTEGHCHRMANYATAIGRALGLGQADLQALHRGGFLHDIGMLAIPPGVILRAGPLAPQEFEQIKSHTVIGDELCRNLRSLRSVRPIIRHHHERRDGSGYPDGLRGDDIPLVAQIISVVDTYDAVTHSRPYQPTQTSADAIQLLRREAEQGLREQHIVETFAQIVQAGELDVFSQPTGH